jgi:hypothetical protein
MGYRMSRQRSLGGYSPCFLLFGRWPIVGASVRDVLQRFVDLDSPAEWARLINERAKVFEKHMPIARSITWQWLSIEICCGTPRRGPKRVRVKVTTVCCGRLRLPKAAEGRLVGRRLVLRVK